jgi:putative molybdopterin biosynthesis protein
MEVAQALHLGAADVGFTIRGAAQAYGLPFLPLLEERFDLVLPEDLASEPRVLRLFDTLASGGFRRELSALGYDTRVSGSKIADVQLG